MIFLFLPESGSIDNCQLLDDGSYNAGSDGSAAFTNSESHSFFDSDRCDQFDDHLGVVSGHAHLGAFGESNSTGVEMFRKLLDQGEAGDNIGVLLRGVQRTEIERGQVLAKPGSIHPHTKYKAQVYVLKQSEGGRHTPFFNGYRPQFYIRTTDVTGTISLPEGVEMCMPGDNVEMTVELITPVAIEEGMRFAIREGGRTVASGVVAAIIE